MDHQRYLELKAAIARQALRYAEPGHPIALTSGEPTELFFDLDLIFHTQDMLVNAAGLLASILPTATTHLGHAEGGSHTPILYGTLMHALLGRGLYGFSVRKAATSLQPERKFAMAGHSAREGAIITALPSPAVVPTTFGGRKGQNKADKSIQGHKPHAGSHVALVDTVTTTAEDLLAIAATLEEATGVTPNHLTVLALIDRQQGARDALTRQGITYQAIFTLSDFLH